MKTYQAKPGDVARAWRVVDLNGKTLGRAASEIAQILRGKNKPQFTPHVDVGDFVVAINAKGIQLSGTKLKSKRYYRHTGYPGGIKSVTAEQLREKKPALMIELAVRGMLPKNTLGRNLLKKLKVYGGATHPHQAQTPVVTEI